jgi:hypothetical protein
MAATGLGRWARKAALFGGAALIVVVAPVVALAVMALASPADRRSRSRVGVLGLLA